MKKKDHCYTTPEGVTYLFEGYCDESNNALYYQIECNKKLGNGYVCSDGACVLSASTPPVHSNSGSRANVQIKGDYLYNKWSLIISSVLRFERAFKFFNKFRESG